MASFKSLKKELALLDMELAILEILGLHGPNDDFTTWFITALVTKRSSSGYFQN